MHKKNALTRTKSNSIQRVLQSHYLYCCIQQTGSSILSRALTGHSKHLLRIPKAIRLGDTNGKPNDAEQKVYHHQCRRESKHCRIEPRRKVVDSYSYKQHSLRQRPDERTPFDIIIGSTTRKINFPDLQLGHDVIRRSLPIP